MTAFSLKTVRFASQNRRLLTVRVVIFTSAFILVSGCNGAPTLPVSVSAADNNMVPAAANDSPPGSINPLPGNNPFPVNNISAPSVNVTLPSESLLGDNEIWIQVHAFNPAILNISVGTTMTWTNKDSEFHTVTSDTGIFGSGLSYKDTYQFTFTKAGTYNYYCDPHPDMTGTIYVK